jgi:hypothetical protein
MRGKGILNFNIMISSTSNSNEKKRDEEVSKENEEILLLKDLRQKKISFKKHEKMGIS